ncbi:phosphate acyltransferase PlsX [Conexibacter sp. W3-3-2]|uniref:phosphate acyltransferase n=1 Tax=Conexibacter sp. W3-3-2 TaxID=2675227 RepID=UPI0028168B73|nr:phosphate acyltransferase PlsX [Conexibacter sp. W3-3-2]
MPDHVTVAVDAGGADLGPAEVAAGAAIAAERGVRVLLFGDASRIDSVPAGVEVVDAPLSIAKEADPARAVRGNPESSIVQAVRAVADGRADAFVSGGSTGAALAAGLFTLKRGRGIHRPALALPIPVPGAPVTLLDVGANVEVRDDHLVQFAFMGAAFAQTVLGVERPRVALLSNGEEPTKGTETVVAAHAEIARRAQDSPLFEFVGNVEGTDLVTGAADVVVTDGFTGNVALKLVEGVSQMMIGAIRDVATSTPRAKAGGLLLRPALRGFRDEIDPEGPGGRVPAGPAPAGSRAARSLHAVRLLAGDPAGGARRVRGRRRPDARGARGGRCAACASGRRGRGIPATCGLFRR